MSKALTTLAIVFLVVISCAPATKPPVVLPPKENRPPSALPLAVVAEMKPSSTSVVTCVATDPDGDKLIYQWTAERGTFNGDGPQVTYMAPAENGEYVITCLVSDKRGGEATATRKFKVTDNPFGSNTTDETIYLKVTVPSGQVVEASRQVRILTTTEIECVVENEGSNKLTFKWTASTGKIIATGLQEGVARRVGWIAPGQAGNYTVSVIITDLGGNQAEGRVNFEVLCCREPR